MNDTQQALVARYRPRIEKLARLRWALVRMEEGDFGFCAECGEPIAAGRLDADPSHHLCVRCAAQQE